MYSEKTEIVDVAAITENNSTTYSLSMKAGDLYEAARNGDVIRRHNISDSPAVVNYAYVGLSEVKKDSNGYKFTFASGDEFTASDADAYPSASSVSDAISGGGSSGGGVLVVNLNMETQTLDKTWKEIHDAMLSGGAVIQIQYDGEDETLVGAVIGAYFARDYLIKTGGLSNAEYHASSASAYPKAEGSR